MSRILFLEPVPVAAFAAFAEAEGWEYEGADPPGDAPNQFVWLVDDETHVHWISDRDLHLVYALVIGPSAARVEDRIRLEFDGYTIGEAVDEFTTATGWPERVERLSTVAAAAPERFDQRVFDAISAGLTDEHEVVRHKAALMVFYVRWPQFLPLLDKIAADDPYDEARRVAAAAAATLRNPEAQIYPALGPGRSEGGRDGGSHDQ